MKFSSLIIIFLFAASSVKASDSLVIKKYAKRIWFFTAGLQAYTDEAMDCHNKQAAKMSFGYKRKAGCVVGPVKYVRIKNHNRRVEKKMLKRYGTDWKNMYESLLKNC